MKKYIPITVSIILLAFSSHILACKMTPLAGSAVRIQAVLDHLNNDPEEQGRTIQSIREEEALSEMYLVQTMTDKEDCKTISYKTHISPDCKVQVEKIDEIKHCLPFLKEN